MKRLFLLFLFCLVVGPVVGLFAAIEPRPVVATRLVSSPTDAARARAVVRKFRALTEAVQEKHLRVSEADMNSVLATSLRAVSAVRGRATVLPDRLRLQFSVDATRLPRGGWLNFSVEVPRSEHGLQLSSVKLGPYALPGQLLLPAFAYVADVILGDGLGHVAVKAIDGVEINGRQVVFGVGLDSEERKALSQGAKDLVRATANISKPEQVRFYFNALDKGVSDGHLGRLGSVVPFLHHALSLAHERESTNPGNDEVKAALLALAIYCGHYRFEQVVGEVVPRNRPQHQSGCSQATLQGRGDLRQHFIISAGLQAAATSNFAFAIGEFKELLDSNRGGSGFSFDDLAADRAGIAMADAFLKAEHGAQKTLLNMLTSEESMMPRTADLPSGMSGTEFKSRYGDINSAAYRDLVQEIDNRIKQLPIYRTR